MTEPAAPPPVRRTDLAADRIRAEILRGTYQVGERLPGERDMAARLGVNRGAVREALKTLELQGLVETRPGGTTVCALHEASIGVVQHLLRIDGVPNQAVTAQLLDVQEILVAGAARMAVERGSEDDVLHAQELVGALANPGLQPEDLPAHFDEIIDLITHASGNLVLMLWRNTLRPALHEQIAPVRHRVRPDPSGGAIVARLVDAIRVRDAAGTEDAARALLRLRRDALLAALAEAEEDENPESAH